MTTLITGATGFLGGELARALVRRGDRVRALVRTTSDHAALEASGVECATGDVTDRASIDAAVAGCDRVFHAAALVKTWVRDRSLYERVNVEGTRNVIGAAASAGVKRIVRTSSFLVLKPGAHITEEPLASEDEVWTDYARSKRLAQIASRALIDGGAPVVTVYPGVIFGPGKITAGNIIVDWMIRLACGKFPGFLGKGTETWSLAFVDDVVRGHLLADEKGEIGRGYCLGGENVAVRAFMTQVAQALDVTPPTRCIPFEVARFAGLLAEWWATLTGHQPELTRAVVDTFRNNWALESTRAKTELGYEITPLNDAIAKTVAWLRREHLVD